MQLTTLVALLALLASYVTGLQFTTTLNDTPDFSPNFNFSSLFSGSDEPIIDTPILQKRWTYPPKRSKQYGNTTSAKGENSSLKCPTRTLMSARCFPRFISQLRVRGKRVKNFFFSLQLQI
jgi:hypothetical protein